MLPDMFGRSGTGSGRPGGGVVQLADGVWRIPTAPADLVNSVAIAGPDGSFTLVDAGLRWAPRRLAAGLAQLGRTLADVTHLVCSHAHPDHVGALAAIARASGAPIAAHEREALYLRRGSAPPPEPSQRGARLLPRFAPGRFAAVDPATELRDGDVIDHAGGLLVVHTPGHTPGHISLLHRPTGTLLAGDAVVNVRGLRDAPALLCTSVSAARSSARRLLDVDFSVVAFAHGPELREGGRRRLEAFLAGRSQ